MADIAQIRRESRIRRHRRVRKKVHGTAERPRLAVFRSNKHLIAQVIDDDAGRTLAAASTAEPDQRAAGSGATVDAATRIGQLVAERAKAAGVEQVVFDRGGFIYHGRIAALAAAPVVASTESLWKRSWIRCHASWRSRPLRAPRRVRTSPGCTALAVTPVPSRRRASS